MKIVAVLENEIAAGGGFNQALNAIQQMAEICKGAYEFEVLTAKRANIDHLKQIGIKAEFVRIGATDYFLSLFANNPVWHLIQKKLRLKGKIERHLDRVGCDLAYFVVPSLLPLALQTHNYIATVWDLCHRDHPEFPEVRSYGEFQLRERMFRLTLPPATAVISDSEQLSARLVHCYGLDPERILAMPFSPAPQVDEPSPTDACGPIKKYRLQPGYFFYPAQLWAHKNHRGVIEAVAMLKDTFRDIRVVFVGGDKGMRDRLAMLMQQLEVKQNIQFLGFVPGNEMPSLYRHCRAVIMPSYFGPTNLPPMEAWLHDRPLIYSCHLSEQTGDAALLVDPDDVYSIADAMRQCFDEKTTSSLTQRGRLRLADIEKKRAHATAALGEMLNRFARRRRCWSMTS